MDRRSFITGAGAAAALGAVAVSEQPARAQGKPKVLIPSLSDE